MTRQPIFDLENDNARGQAGKVGKAEFSDANRTPPMATGQCAQVLNRIRQYQPQLSFVLTPDHAIPEAAARVHNLRNMDFNITTTILPEVEFRGVIRRNAALYSLGSPEWPRPGFFENEEVSE